MSEWIEARYKNPSINVVGAAADMRMEYLRNTSVEL
jgi:hypothetical protein